MSRQEELLKLAKLFHSQASTTQSPAAKRSLRKMGDYYQHETKQLGGQASSDSGTERPSGKHLRRHHERAA
jgi:hypothetical protein